MHFLNFFKEINNLLEFPEPMHKFESLSMGRKCVSNFSFIYSANITQNYHFHLAFTYTCFLQKSKKISVSVMKI